MKINYKLDISLYMPKESIDLPKELVKNGYDIRLAIKNVVLNRDQKHRGFRFYTISKVIDKITACKEDFVILDNTEYQAIKESFDNFSGFSHGDVELVRRVYEAERIEEV